MWPHFFGGIMKPVLGILCALVFTLGLKSQESAPHQQPMTFTLECPGGDCPLLKGAPQTMGMRGGHVRLKPGENVGWHSTGRHEEALVILQGQGTANIEGHADVPLRVHVLAYFPPDTKHNVTNTSNQILEYVWIVAPVTNN
jgi:mannose-6-phosphate isomerase-like protein (cupin superfamily)